MEAVAEETYQLLRGVICAYKPSGSSTRYVINKLKSNICAGLNGLETKSVMRFPSIEYPGDELCTNVKHSYANNVLCSGPRYQNHNFSLFHPSSLGDFSSGVMAVCVNEDNKLVELLRRLNFTKCFHVKGILGQATANFQSSGKVINKAKYDKIDRTRFNKVIAAYQGVTQRRIFEDYGFHLQSQEAYEFAVKGLYRPIFRGAPIVYSIQLVDFKPPEFILEVQCVHETEEYLLQLINYLGLNLKCFATCTGIRCIRYGCFYVEHSLVKEEWTLDRILKNIHLCWGILEKQYPGEMEFSRTVGTKHSVKTEDEVA